MRWFWVETQVSCRYFSIMLLQDRIGLKPNLVFASDDLSEIGRFNCLDSYISLGGCILIVSSLIQRAQSPFISLWHLWRRYDIRLSAEGGVYTIVVRSMLLYASESLPLKAEGTRGLSMSKHCCFYNIDRIWWENCLSTSDVMLKGSGPRIRPLKEALSRNRLK